MLPKVPGLPLLLRPARCGSKSKVDGSWFLLLRRMPLMPGLRIIGKRSWIFLQEKNGCRLTGEKTDGFPHIGALSFIRIPTPNGFPGTGMRKGAGFPDTG